MQLDWLVEADNRKVVILVLILILDEIDLN